MRRAMTGLAASPPRCSRPTPASAQDTVKIGVIMSYSGQFADTGAQIGNGIKLYMKEHGDTVAGKKIELIIKDSGGIAPDVAKRLSQEADRPRQGRHPRGLRPDAERARRRRRVGAGQEVHGRHERRDLDHHHQVALHGAHLVHACRWSTRSSANGPTRTASARPIRWSPTSALAMTAKPPSSRASRTPAARSSARRAIRWRTRTSPPSCSAPRTSTRTRSTSGCRAARSLRRSAKRSPSAASTRTRSRSWARAS